MIPSLLLLTGFAAEPTPLQLFLARSTQKWDRSAMTVGRQPNPQGPDAIFLKYNFKAIPMGGYDHPAWDNPAHTRKLLAEMREQKRLSEDVQRLLEKLLEREEPR